MVRRYAHSSVDRLAVYADRLSRARTNPGTVEEEEKGLSRAETRD